MKKSCSLLDILRPASGRETLRRTPDGRRRHAGYTKQTDPYRQLRPNIIKFIEEVIPTSMHNDKDVVNGVYKNHIKVLPLKYNVLTPLYEKTYDQIREYYNIEDNYYSDHNIKSSIAKKSFWVNQWML